MGDIGKIHRGLQSAGRVFSWQKNEKRRFFMEIEKRDEKRENGTHGP
jgi:hypothetical protein